MFNGLFLEVLQTGHHVINYIFKLVCNVSHFSFTAFLKVL